jgi:cell division protein FtsW
MDNKNHMPPKKSPKKLSGIDRAKIKIKKELDKYLENRRKKLSENDVVFSESLRPEKQKEVVLARGGIDKWFLLLVLFLLAFGAIMSFSASSVYAENKYGDSAYFFKRYIIFAVMSVIAFTPIVMFMTPRYWKAAGVIMYAATVVLLLLVLVIGDTGGGAQRWIDLKFITIQPSEIAKMALVMVLALYMSKHEKEVTSTHQFGGSFKHGVLIPGCIIGLIIVLVALEKHISGIIIIGMIGISVMFVGGTRWKWIALIIGVVALAACGLVLVSDYAQVRVNTWLNIDAADPRGSAWQTLQGLYAIGSGGLFGKGLGNSLQKYGYVSEPQNDFIFAIVSEELGFIGATLIILLYAALICRGIMIGMHSRDRFGTLLAFGMVFQLGLQVALNIAVVTDTVPNTGIGLPFFSYGGSSMLICLAEMGVVLSVSRQANMPKVYTFKKSKASQKRVASEISGE